jgi:hypothetical protein
MTKWSTPWLLTTVVAASFVLAPASHAQTVTLPADVIQSSPEASVQKRQLRLAGELGRRVLQGLQAAPTNRDVPVDPSVIQDARNTYVLIRAAKEGMEAAEYRRAVAAKGVMKDPDPMFDFIHKRIVDAWNLARTPVDLPRDDERPHYLATSIHDLSRALQLVDQVLTLLP